MSTIDVSVPPFSEPVTRERPRADVCDLLRRAMQMAGYLEVPAPPAALRWIETFVDAFGDGLATIGDALPEIAALRAEAVTLPALHLEKLRDRQVLFFLDAVGQYVDDQPELRDLPVERDVTTIASEFGIAPDDALWALRMTLTARADGPPLELLFPLLGHDRIMLRVGAVASHLLHGRGLEPIKIGPGGAPFETLHGRKPA